LSARFINGASLCRKALSHPGAKMVTRKIATKVATKASVLKFNPDWFTDPGPETLGLKASAVKELEKAKKDFAKRVNEILAKGRQ
jgi:hypothetical protein